MKSTKYLDDLMRKNEFRRDKELAKLLGVTAATISQYRSGARVMDNETCLRIAIALETDPMPIIMAADIDRAERSGQRSLWESFSRKAAAFAGVAVMASSVNLFLTVDKAEASILPMKTESVKKLTFDNNINYAKLRACRPVHSIDANELWLVDWQA